MSARSIAIVPLSQLVPGQEADLFALLSAKEELTTRDGKRYYRVAFRDHAREVSFPIWAESPHAADCAANWTAGAFYKLRATYRQTGYGPQLDIERIREVTDADRADGFDPDMCRPRSRFDVEALHAELLRVAETEIRRPELQSLAVDLLTEHRAALCALPASERLHHAYAGGWLEHTHSTLTTAIFLADRYLAQYPDLRPPLDRDLVVVGALLHDIGKLRELAPTPLGAELTAPGHLIGHIVQGRDLVREAAADRDIEPELLLRLEHILLSHHETPEYGAPKPPMTPEALLVRYADDIDAKFHMFTQALASDTGDGPVTSKKNALGRHVYRGG